MEPWVQNLYDTLSERAASDELEKQFAAARGEAYEAGYEEGYDIGYENGDRA